jgi:hypothetical protein
VKIEYYHSEVQGLNIVDDGLFTVAMEKALLCTEYYHSEVQGLNIVDDGLFTVAMKKH